MPVGCTKCGFNNRDDSRFCGRCGAPLVEDDAASSFTRTMETPADSMPPGAIFAGRYRIIEKLGQGGMGFVFKAFDMEIQERVAVKFIRPEISSDWKTIERFRNEIKNARRITHKNVCRMHDLNKEGDAYYITMELVEGEDLKSFIRRSGALTIGKAVSIAGQICEGLSEAHKLGIVHRDLKPQNIMIDREGNARIMDFGIARSMTTSGITGEGMMIGTPEYMAPEQAAGEDVDIRADLYSAGVILFEMLTGRLPFFGATPLDVALKHRTEPAPDPRVFNAAVSQELKEIVLKCLKKLKSERYPDAAALLADLDKIKESVTLPAAVPIDKTVVSRDRSRRFPASVVVFLAFLIVLLGVGGYLLLRPKAVSGDPGWKNSLAVLPFVDSSVDEDQEYFCTGMTDALIVKLSQAQELKVIGTSAVLRYRGSGKTSGTIASELGVSHVLEGSVLREGDRVRISAQLINPETEFTVWSESYTDEMKDILALQDKISLAIAGALKVKLGPGEKGDGPAEIKNPEAYEYYLKGMHCLKSRFLFTFSDTSFETTVEMFRKAVELDKDFPLAWYGLSWAYEHRRQVTHSSYDQEHSIINMSRAYVLDPHSALINAGWGYKQIAYDGQVDEGFELYKKALSINANLPEVNFTVGASMEALGLSELALPYLEKSYALDPYYFWSPYKLGVACTDLGQYERADKYFESYFDVNPVNMPVYPGSYTEMLILTGRIKEAEEVLARESEEDPDAGWIRKYRAILAALRGEKEKALNQYICSEVYALLGMTDKALALLEEEINRPRIYPKIHYNKMKNSSFYDNLRRDARYKSLLKKEKERYDTYSGKWTRILSE